MSIIIPGTKLAGAASHPIDQSIRFNDDDSPELTKTYSGAGSRTTQTFSVWFKLGNTQSSSGFNFYNGGTGTSDTTWSGISIYDHKIYLQGYSTNWKITTRVLRDHSAWYHLVYIWDTTNSVASERVRLYINGQRETDFSTDNNPGASASSGIGQAAKHSIGNQSRVVGYSYADAYMAEIVFIDGTAYGPENFGEENDNGIWVPKDVSGLTFGTNGFWIDGRDSGDLGDDESGRGNDYTASGLAAHDQMTGESPTNNFCVMNPINKHSNVTLSNGNLHALGSGTSISYASAATISLPSSGKWYAEMKYTNASAGEYPMVGVFNNSVRALINVSNSPGGTGASDAKDIGFGADGRRLENGTNTEPWENAVSDGNISALAIDMDNKKIWFGHNNSGSFVWQASGNPSAGSNEANTIDFNTTELVLGNGHYSTSEVHWNFGQDGTFGGTETAQNNSDANGVGNFYFSVPTGFKAICTKNLGS